MTDPVSVGSGSSTALVVWDTDPPTQSVPAPALDTRREMAIVVYRRPQQDVAEDDDDDDVDDRPARRSLTSLLKGASAEPEAGDPFDEKPATEAAASPASDPHDWVAQSAAMQRSLAEMGQKTAMETALLKLQNDLNDATVSMLKNIGSSIKAAAQ